MHQRYGGAIWTHHALDRMRDRGLSQEWAWQAFTSADQTRVGKQTGTTEYQKRFDQYKVTVIAKRNEKNEWIIISAWIDPPLAGSIDMGKKEAYQRYQKASFLGKMLRTLKKQLGF